MSWSDSINSMDASHILYAGTGSGCATADMCHAHAMICAAALAGTRGLRSAGKKAMPRRVYVLESVLPFGEDSRHEFKGHRYLSVEELPKSSFIPGTLRRSKKAISRYVVDVG